MKRVTKIIISSLVSLLGLGMYIVLYFLVPMSKQNDHIQYWIMILGYTSVIIFPFGFFTLMKEIGKKKPKTLPESKEEKEC